MNEIKVCHALVMTTKCLDIKEFGMVEGTELFQISWEGDIKLFARLFFQFDR